MEISELAARDQAEAADREFGRKAQRVALAFMGTFLIAGGYAMLALGGWVPAAPWSPVGEQPQERQAPPSQPVMDGDSVTV